MRRGADRVVQRRDGGLFADAIIGTAAPALRSLEDHTFE